MRLKQNEGHEAKKQNLNMIRELFILQKQLEL